MAKSARFRDTGKGSFFGDFLYQSIIQRHRDHFLVAVYHLFDWSAWSEKLLALYKGRGERGAPPYDPVMLFKILFLSYLYDTSERAIVEMADLNLLLKWFLGLAVDEEPPDHSSLTVFKRRLQEGQGWATLQAIFADLIQQARAQGLKMGCIQVLDSVHTCADVDAAKERQREEQGHPPRDPDARLVHKGRRRVVTPEGQTKYQQVCHMGYKTHASVNAETGIVTAIDPALGNSADNKAFPALRQQDRDLDLPTEIYAGDRAYDDTDIHERLEAEGLVSGIHLKTCRTHKKDPHKERWLALEADPRHQRGRRARYRVEQVFGLAKRWHGFRRCRYLGLERYRVQSAMTFMVCNAKRIIKRLTGITLRPLAKGRRAEVFEPVYATLPWA